ncbi:hypothetical protein EDD11_008479 [Mortierella claussenii]|nr:hypothetical protein EDD11_008479 [Mortierella claussenii]
MTEVANTNIAVETAKAVLTDLDSTRSSLTTDTKRTAEGDASLLALHNSFKPIWLTPTITVGPWFPSDRKASVEYLNDDRIHPYIWGPPYPYKLEHADFWLGTEMRLERVTDKGTPLDFCMRDMARGGKAIGGLAVTNQSDEKLDEDDTGYWLAPEYHGQGLMSKALRLMLHRVSMLEVGKRKFNAHVCLGNVASRRVLEKAGFKILKKEKHTTVVKNGVEMPLWTLRLYVTDEEVENWQVESEATPLASLV